MIDISGDAGIKAYGKTVEELFANAARGMYSLITDPGGFTARETLALSVESHSVEGLLVAWLNELIFYFDTRGFVGKEMRIELSDDNRLGASILGEKFDVKRHERRLLVKAATYHRLSIEKKGDLWEAEVIFDI